MFVRNLMQCIALNGLSIVVLTRSVTTSRRLVGFNDTFETFVYAVMMSFALMLLMEAITLSVGQDSQFPVLLSLWPVQAWALNVDGVWTDA